MMRGLYGIFLGAAAFLALAAPAVFAAPTTIFDSTESASHGTRDDQYITTSSVIRAQAFTVGATGGLLTSLILQDAYINPYTSNYVVSLYSDSGGALGSQLVTFGSSPSHPGNGLLTFTPSGSYTLLANTTYWIRVGITTGGGFWWKYKNGSPTTGTVPASGYRAYSSNSGSSFVYDSSISSSAYGTGSWRYNMKVVVDPAGDTTAPTITSISSNKANGTYKAGSVIDIDVVFSEAVTSTGNVTVTLETGDTDRTCTFTVTNSTTGTCDYTVQAGDLSATVSGTIADQASNAMTNFTPSTGLAANKAIVIDTTPPPAPTPSPAAGTYSSVQSVTLTSSGSSAIYYTTNGSNPTTGSTLYSSAISVGSSQTIKAIATDAVGNESSVMSAAYVINLDSSAPAISGVSASASGTSATITWTTDEA